METVRTRFAPSPTGEMHVGNLRVAIFNYLFARKHRGALVLRVEDTDVERNLQGSLEGLMEDLHWAGIHWDEGPTVGGRFGPYFQSQRSEEHVRRAFELRDAGLAYRCFCSDDEVEATRRDVRSSPGCPGGCRDLQPTEAKKREAEGSTPAALRFTVPDSVIHIKDEIRGDIDFHGKDIGDFIILRADGRATYNFAVVVDDLDMEITHVIRGAGHLSNTPKQALLFDALGSGRPVFAHLPTVLGPDGSKLSKRTGAPGIARIRAEGYHPEGVVNYLSLLGWSPGDDREVMSTGELISALDLNGVGSSNTVFDPEKMKWMSAQHIGRMTSEDLTNAVEPYVDWTVYPRQDFDLRLGVEALRSRLHTFAEVNEALGILFPSASELEGARGELATSFENAAAVLDRVRARFETLDPWDAEAATACVREVGKELEVRGADLFHPLRLALCGDRSGPDLGKVVAALGKERTVERLNRALQRLDGAA